MPSLVLKPLARRNLNSSHSSGLRISLTLPSHSPKLLFDVCVDPCESAKRVWSTEFDSVGFQTSLEFFVYSQIFAEYDEAFDYIISSGCWNLLYLTRISRLQNLTISLDVTDNFGRGARCILATDEFFEFNQIKGSLPHGDLVR